MQTKNSGVLRVAPVETEPVPSRPRPVGFWYWRRRGLPPKETLTPQRWSTARDFICREVKGKDPSRGPSPDAYRFSIPPAPYRDESIAEWVTALAVKVTNIGSDGTVVEPPSGPDELALRIPFMAAAWTTHDSSPTWDKFIYIIPYARAQSASEDAKIRAHIAKCLPEGTRLIPPSEFVPFPEMPSDWWRDDVDWPDVFDGECLSVEAIPVANGGCGSSLPEEEEPDPTSFMKAISALSRSYAVRWAEANPQRMTDELMLALGSNYAAIPRAYEALCDEAGHLAEDGKRAIWAEARDQFVRLAEPVRRIQNGFMLPEELWYKRLFFFERAAANGAELRKLGMPDELVRQEGESLAERALETVGSFACEDPTNWVFDMTKNQYVMIDNAGRPSDRGYVDAAFTTYLQSLLGTGDAKVKEFKRQILSCHTREPLLDTRECIAWRGNRFVLNSYVRPTLEPRSGELTLIRKLLLNLVDQDERAVEFILDWLALPVQELRLQGKYLKLLTALVFHGDQGAGKGTLIRLLQHIYGKSNVAVLDQARLEGRFSDVLEHKLLVVANEVVSATADERKLANKIKGFVTDAEVTIEAKYGKPYDDLNRFNMIFASNDDRPVKVEPDDRRFSVFHSSRRLEKDLEDAIYADLEGQAGVLLHELLSRKPRISIRDLYDNSARRNVMAASMTVVEQFVDRALAVEGFIGLRARGGWKPGVDSVFAIKDGEKREYVTFPGIVSLFRAWCEENGAAEPKAINDPLATALKRRFPGVTLDRPLLENGKKGSVWTGIPLEVGDAGQPLRQSGDPARPAEAGRPTDNLELDF